MSLICFHLYLSSISCDNLLILRLSVYSISTTAISEYYYRIRKDGSKKGGPSCSPIDRRATSFHLACQNILAHSPQGIMVIRVEIDSRLLISLNQSASMLPTVGRMTWRLSSRNCTYGEPSPPRLSLPPRPSIHRLYTRARVHARLEPALPTDRLLSICIVH